jgi:hypothetical protein
VNNGKIFNEGLKEKTILDYYEINFLYSGQVGV